MWNWLDELIFILRNVYKKKVQKFLKNVQKKDLQIFPAIFFKNWSSSDESYVLTSRVILSSNLR